MGNNGQLLGKYNISFDGVDEAIIRRERDKARKLKKTRWWQKKLAQGVCYYCGANVLSSELTMDHHLPVSRGGTSVKGNLVTSCKQCNNKKKSLLSFEWQEYMQHLEQ